MSEPKCPVCGRTGQPWLSCFNPNCTGGVGLVKTIRPVDPRHIPARSPNEPKPRHPALDEED